MGKKFNFFCFAELLFFVITLISMAGMRVTPLSPRGEGNPRGASPEPPHHEVFSSTCLEELSHCGGCPAAGVETRGRSP